MRKPIRRSYFILALLSIALPAMFNACGGPNGFHALQDPSGIGSLSSSAPSPATVQKRLCESELIAVYSNTYHPLMKNNCNFCHSSAHGSNDLRLSFNSFRAKGQDVIDARASSPHGGNNINISSQIAVVHQPYADAETAYTKCMEDNPAETPSGLTFAVKEKPLTGLTANFREYAWDLYVDSTDRAQQIKATFRIEARIYLYQGTNSGIEFKNPSIQLAAGQADVLIEGVRFTVNGVLQDTTTTYAQLSQTISGTTKTNIAPMLGSALVHLPGASATTLVGFQFTNLK